MTFEERHPGLKGKGWLDMQDGLGVMREWKSVDDYAPGHVMFPADVVEATQIDKEIVREAKNRAMTRAMMRFCNSNEVNSQRSLIDAFIEEFEKELGL